MSNEEQRQLFLDLLQEVLIEIQKQQIELFKKELSQEDV